MTREDRSRLLALFLSLLLLTALPLSGVAAEVPETDLATTCANELKTLGLFQGVSDTDFDLDRAPTRAEALVMLIRSLGQEKTALSGTWEMPFTDVANWVAPYVGYAYENGLTTGISLDQFGGERPADAVMYLTFMLRALGYSDAEDDFFWAVPDPLATECGLLPSEVDRMHFLRRDVVYISYAALHATLKDSKETLGEKLCAAGMFTAEQYRTAIDPTRFADSLARTAAISDAITAAIAAHEGLPLGKNQFDFTLFLIGAAEEKEDVCSISALSCYARCTLREHGVPQRNEGSIQPLSIQLRKAADGTYEVLSYWTAAHPESAPTATEETKFSPAFLNAVQNPWFTRMDSAANTEAIRRAKGLTFQYPSYEEKCAELLGEYGSQVITRLDAPGYGTILLRWVGAGPHGVTAELSMVMNADSPLPEGSTVQFPLRFTVFLSEAPHQISLNEAQDTLTYSFTYSDRAADGEHVFHEIGTYLYTVDLATATVKLQFINGNQITDIPLP